MRVSFFLVLFMLASAGSFAQQKYFEGVQTYSVTVGSKILALDDNFVRKLLATGEVVTIYVKDGNYRHSSSLSDTWYRQKEKRVFYKFKHLDTLYYQDYSDDTSKVTDVLKDDAITRMNDMDCKSLTIKTANATLQFYYAPSLRNNPDYDRNNTIGHFDVYTRETGGAIWLKQHDEFSFGWITETCSKVEPKTVDTAVFALPDLPQRKFGSTQLSSLPRFPGKEGAWAKYLGANLDPDKKLTFKYVKLPKGDSVASQQVMVRFTVLADGQLTNIQVVNKDEVHPKLAEEAMRVIRESPRWIPCMVYGEKVAYPTQQPVTFKVMR